MGKKLIFVITFILLPLSGCSVFSIGYNNADIYLRYTINSYAPFNDEQQKTIHKNVDGYMLWHRKQMLQEYVIFLQALQQTVKPGVAVTREDVARIRKEVRTLYVKTLQPSLRPAAVMLSSLESQQIEALVKSFARENGKKWEEDFSGNAEEQLRKRADKTIDILESLVGDFSDAQLEKVREISLKLPYTASLYLRLREDNQANLIELLKYKKAESEIESFLYAWLTVPEANRSAAEKSLLLSFQVASEDMIAHVYEMLTPQQKNTLLKNIGKYIDIFQQLAGQS